MGGFFQVFELAQGGSVTTGATASSFIRIKGTTWLSSSNRICLKKWHFPDLVCSIHGVNITTGLSLSNRICLKKWHFPDLVCSVHEVTITTGLSYSNRSDLNKI